MANIITVTNTLTTEEVRFLSLVGVGGLAPRTRGKVTLREVTPLWGEVKPVSWDAKLPNHSFAEGEWRWEPHTPSCFRRKRENSKKWRKNHGKLCKQLAKRQGLCR